MAKGKRVILLIVEGTTDESALSPILKKIFDRYSIHFRITRGDLLVKTEENDINPSNAIIRVNTQIKNEMNRYGYKPKDMLKVIHVIDTDGAFIPNDKVIFNDKERLKYCIDRIETVNPDIIRHRNEGKKAVVQRLRNTKKIGGIPYCMLFFSRNLEHALHGILRELSIDEKVDLADEFAEKYSDDIEGFKSLITSTDVKVPGNYEETWEHILTGTNSLGRFSNLHLILEDKQLFSIEEGEEKVQP